MACEQHIIMEPKCYLLPKVSIMATCFLLFTLQSYREVDKYFSGMTSVAMRKESNQNLPFPTIVICLKEPFKRHKYPVTSEEYRNLTYSLEEILDTDNSSPNISQGLVVEEIATYLNGMCFVLRVPEDWTYPKHVFIALKTDRILHVYFVDKGQDLCILYGSQCGKNVRNGRFVTQEMLDTGIVIVRLKVEKRVEPDR